MRYSAGTPFCELHVHLEGTLEPATIFQLAAAQEITLRDPDEAALGARYRFSNLQSFLDLYYENMTVLRREEDFATLTSAYLLRASNAGVAHAEIFVDPQAHSARGVPTDTVLRGVRRAIATTGVRLGISADIIVCVLRDQPVESAHRMLDAVFASGIPVLAIGLDSAEVGYPPSLFAGVFERARAEGLRAVAHAGEEGPASYIWEALDLLGAERIDHGIRALDDDALIERLRRDRIPLTVCPLSSVRLKVVGGLRELPLRALLERDVLVTINSDDPAYFGGYLDDNIAAIAHAFELTADEIELLAQNSIEASFLSPAAKAALRA